MSVLVFGTGLKVMGHCPLQFAGGFTGIFLLATLAYVLAGQSVVKHYNLEYALWALAVGLIISNTVGTPQFMKPAVRTEFYIKTGLVILGRMDGRHWKELARAPVAIDVNQPERLRVNVAGSQINVHLNGKSVLSLTDDTWQSGAAGLRVVDTHAVFSDLTISTHAD